jgi:hypothetical protein
VDRHRRTAAALTAALALTAVAGCKSQPASNPAVRPPTVGGVDAKVHPALDEFEAFEVAVLRPTGTDVDAAVLDAFREGLYQGLLSKGYSPLSPAYVDTAGVDVAMPGRTFPMRSHITSVRHSRDGGYLVSGWVGLVSPGDDGAEETLYVSEITDLAIRHERRYQGKDGGPRTGGALATALLRHLPDRQ